MYYRYRRWGDYQLIYPDTISRSEKLTLKITGTGAMHTVSKSVGITAINEHESSARVEGDSCVFYKGTLSGCNTGPATVCFNVKFQKGSTMDSSRGPCSIQYNLMRDIPVYINP